MRNLLRRFLAGPYPYAALMIGIFAAYWPVHDAVFVYDDGDYIGGNPHVWTGLTLDNVRWAFTHSHSANWHPLTWISHQMDVSLFAFHGGGHHLMNLLFHAIAAMLLFRLLSAMTQRPGASFVVAAIFAVHPVNVETVAWISERKNILCTIFMLLSILAYRAWCADRRIRRYVPAALWFGCALLSKPMAVVLPAVLLLIDFWPLQRIRTGGPVPAGAGQKSIAFLLWEKIPLFCMSIALCAITIMTQHAANAMPGIGTLPIGLRLSNAIVSYSRYLFHIFWPDRLSCYYPYAGWQTPLRVAGSIALLASISTLVFALSRRYRWLAAGWLWYLGILVPMIGIIQVGIQSMADRYAYVPIIGIAIMVVWSAVEVGKRIPHWRFIGPVVASGLILVLGCKTWIDAHSWHDPIALNRHSLEITGMMFSPIAERNLGSALMQSRKYAEALPHTMAAAIFAPNSARLQTDIGINLMQLRREREAVAHLRKAVDLDPSLGEAWFNLGLGLQACGDSAGALACFGRVTGLNPSFAPARINAALILQRQGNTDSALAIYSAILANDSTNGKVRFKRAIVRFDRGDYTHAIEDFRVLFRLSNAEPFLHFKAGIAFMRLGAIDSARNHLTVACRLDSTKSEYRDSLAVCRGRK